MALKVAMHNWMRAGADRDDDRAARAQRIRRNRDLGRAGDLRREQSAGCSNDNGLECWGAVTLMTGGRDLVHEDHYVRLASVAVRQGLPPLSSASWAAEILTVVPSTVGKVDPMGVARGGVALVRRRASRSARRTPSRSACGSGVEPLNRFETYFINRADQAVALAEEVGGRLRRRARHLPHEHRGGRLGAGDPRHRRLPGRLPRRRQQPDAVRAGRDRLGGARPRAGRRSATTTT